MHRSASTASGCKQGTKSGKTHTRALINTLLLILIPFLLMVVVFNIGFLIFDVRILLIVTLVKYVGYLSNIFEVV